MYDKLLKWSGIIGSILMMFMIIGMLVYSSQKGLVYVQAQGQQESVEQSPDSKVHDLVLLMPEERENQNKFYIPVADGVTQDAIRIENDSMNHRLKVTIDGMQVSFFEQNPMYGKTEGIAQIQAGKQSSGIVIYVMMDHLYEYEAVLENQKLGLVFYRPAQIYDNIVVLDVGHGGSDKGISQNGVNEAEVCMDVAERVKKQLEADGICVYLTRGSGDTPDDTERIAFADEAQADLYLSLHLSDGTAYGINAYYNDTYFVPGVNNAIFADTLVKETASAVNNRGNGIFAVDRESEEELLNHIETVAARLTLGCPGDAQEAALLKRSDYREDLASGISNAVRKCLEER